MIAAICTRPGKIVIKNVPVPKPKDNEVLVKVKAAGICGSDVDGYLGRHPMIGYPIILGHECSGVITAAGKKVSRKRIGEAVIVEPFALCHKCVFCRQGKYNLCNDLKIIGHQIPGAFAEYVVIESRFAHRKPANLSFEEAAVMEPATGSMHAVKRCGLRKGNFVVILGCGTIGSFALQHCKNAGAKILVSEIEGFKLKAARKLGASYTVNPKKEDLRKKVMKLTNGVGADCVIEAVGSQQTLDQTVPLVKKGGTIMLIGWTGAKQDKFDLTNVTFNELKVLGTLGFCNDHATAIKLVAQGKINIKKIITHRFSLPEVEKGIKMLHSRRDHIWKAVVIF